MARVTACVAAAALTLVPGGCYTEGGPGYSADQFTYVSTSWRPWTITLKDTRTGQDFWSIDVPVAKKLVIHFQPEEGTGDQYTPDLMTWGILDASEGTGYLGNKLPVPGQHDRRIDATLRPVPELPEGMTPSKRPPVSVQAPSATRPRTEAGE